MSFVFTDSKIVAFMMLKCNCGSMKLNILICLKLNYCQ